MPLPGLVEWSRIRIPKEFSFLCIHRFINSFRVVSVSKEKPPTISRLMSGSTELVFDKSYCLYIFCFRTCRNCTFWLSILASRSLDFKLFFCAPRGHSMHPFMPLVICGFPDSGELHCPAKSGGLSPSLPEPWSGEIKAPFESLPLESLPFIPSTDMIL